MRKSLFVSFLIFAVLAVPAARPAQAATAKLGKNLWLTVGGTLWVNTWTTWDTGVQQSGNQVFRSVTARNQPTFIGTTALKYKRVFVAASFMGGGDYTFENSSLVATRREVDINLGFNIVPQLALTVGYKRVSQTFGPNEFIYDGPTAGVTGSSAIGHGLSIWFNGAGGALSLNTDPATAFTGDSLYVAAAGGIAWKPSTLPLSFTTGYKFQKIETNLDAGAPGPTNPDHAIDLTSGPIFSATFIF